MEDRKLVRLIVGVILGGIALIILLALSPITTISVGHRGVVTRAGVVSEKVLGEGWHWVTPILEDVTEINVQIQKEEVTAGAASKDLQSVSSKTALNYSLQPDKVHLLFQKIGKDYKERIISPAIQEAVKSVTAKYTAEELITKREQVKEDIRQLLLTRLQDEYITVHDFSIIDFDFSAEFNRAIESKQTAQQEALRAKNELERVKTEAEQRVAQAEAEARAIRVQSEAANNQNYVQLKALEVQLEAIKRWNGQLPQQFVPGSALPFLGLK